MTSNFDKEMSIKEAANIANQRGVDIVVVDSKTTPPTCKLLNFSKFMYEQNKKKKQAKQKAPKVKEIRLKYGIASNDIKQKAKNAARILQEGCRVRVVVLFPGRKITFIDNARAIAEEFKSYLNEILSFQINSPLTQNGNVCEMMISIKEGKA